MNMDTKESIYIDLGKVVKSDCVEMTLKFNVSSYVRQLNDENQELIDSFSYALDRYISLPENVVNPIYKDIDCMIDNILYQIKQKVPCMDIRETILTGSVSSKVCSSV